MRQKITIRDVTGISELHAVEEMQMEVWGCSERDVVPALALIPALEVGGMLLGAFDGPTLVGFAYGFVGCEDNRLILHSDMLGVKPEYRDCDLGYGLKLAQRERAITRGIDVITWTFDPLQSRNAHLNFAKLGAIATRYLINYYGEESSSVLHRGAPTDRLWMRWPLRSERVTSRLAGKQNQARPASHEEMHYLIRVRPDGQPACAKLSAKDLQFGLNLLIEIPNDINRLRERDPQQILVWREATRAAFTAALTCGYHVKNFFRPETNQGAGVYLLTRDERNKELC